jgi:ABC-type multidrug transport system fused ATPase/permease subunit
VGQLTLLLFVRIGDDNAREHLLTITDDSNGRLNHDSRSVSRDGSQRHKSLAHVSIQNLVEPKNNLLKGISVEIKPGLIYCIIGPSGSGKVVTYCDQCPHSFSLISILV